MFFIHGDADGVRLAHIAEMFRLKGGEIHGDLKPRSTSRLAILPDTRTCPGKKPTFAESVKGGEVITGGAPLDLIVEKVQTIQSMFYRTVECIKDLPL